MMTVSHATGTWRKASRSTGSDTCVELACIDAVGGLVRDSKNPTGPALRMDRPVLLAAVRSQRLDR